jgi:formate dehydrogenase major subunit
MTNHWIDFQNADVIMINGCNPAENHPLAWYWIRRALDRGAKLINIDPRFTRTSSQADLYAQIRPGTNIVFYGGLINYILEHELYQKDYLLAYTNASTLINPAYSLSDGLFSGYDPARRTYDPASWQYQLAPDGTPKRDETLQDPQTVFQLLRRHYARYDADTVVRVTGIPKEKFLEIAALYASTGRPDRAGTILYAMGQTQATIGTQNIRALAIIQLLLGNIGIPGGGVNALRGEANVQGATDMGLLWNSLPGYLNIPRQAAHPTLADYLAKETPRTSYWANRPNFFISLLKAWWGDAATPENDFGYDWLPKANKDCSVIELFDAMYRGTIKGFLVIGENPAVGSPNSNKVRRALEKLDWLVVVDAWMTETAEFWTAKRPLPDIDRTADPTTIGTEVFFLPAAGFNEKAGSYTNSGRWIQWNDQAAEPEGDARSDLWIIDRLYRAVRAEYAGSTAAKDQGLLRLHWDYGDPPRFEAVAREINGYDVATGQHLPGFAALKADGSTACGNWIYSGFFPDPQTNRAAARDRRDPSGLGFYPGWAYAWPANRRILYNRASADPQGRPWDPKRALIWWDPQGGPNRTGSWVGHDVPDFPPTKAPDAPTRPDGVGLDALAGTDPFIMKTDGRGWLFVPSGLADGPLPEHYEPYESPLANPLSSVPFNPAAKLFAGPLDTKGEAAEFPVIATTFRLTEHYQTGSETRNRPWLVELMPEMFVEMHPRFAAERGIRDGDLVRIESARGAILARAVLTERIQPLRIGDRTFDLVALPWHWGFSGLSTGHSANVLTPTVGDANTLIQEDKAFLVRVTKATTPARAAGG